eukprot:gene1424-12044_t
MKNISILDASWHLPVTNRNAKKEFLIQRIPGATFFDIDQISDLTSNFPHMLPTEKQFENQVGELGINNESNIVVYDTNGLSASRVFWMFKFFGHENISLLDGGFEAWKNEFPDQIEKIEPKKPEKTFYKANFNENYLKNLQQVIENINTKEFELIDARPSGRFNGTEPEPREGLLSGSIPNSFNVFFKDCYDEEGKFKSKEDLKKLFEKNGVDLTKPIITSCGSGVTGCVLLTALDIIGVEKKSLYDGSWTEFGSTKL